MTRADILPTAVTPVLLKLPLRDTLFVDAISNSLLSVTASASGNTVTALEQLQECLLRAASMPAENVLCYTAVSRRTVCSSVTSHCNRLA